MSTGDMSVILVATSLIAKLVSVNSRLARKNHSAMRFLKINSLTILPVIVIHLLSYCLFEDCCYFIYSCCLAAVFGNLVKHVNVALEMMLTTC